MRVVFHCAAAYGHFYPMVPLAEAVADAGHDVLLATGERLRPEIEARGFRAAAVGPPDLRGLVREKLGARFDERARMAPDDQWRWDVDNMSGVLDPLIVGDLVPLLRDWRAEVLVHDLGTLAGPLAARQAGIPNVCHGWGVLDPDFIHFRRSLGWLDHLWRQAGLEPEPFGGLFRHLYLDVCPPSLRQPLEVLGPQLAQVSHPLQLAPVGGRPDEAAPDWLGDLGDRPTVYVTLGTVASAFNVDPVELFRAVLADLSCERIELVVTTGHDLDPTELGTWPPNVHLERFISHTLVLPACDLVVCHGGAGTVLGALAHGLPLLLLPLGADQFFQARACDAAGVGRIVAPAGLRSGAVRDAVLTLLATPDYHHAAEGIAAEIAAMPSPVDVVAILEALTERSGGSQRR